MDQIPMMSDNPQNKNALSSLELIKILDRDVIGKGLEFFGPFGKRNYVYVDYTASGKALGSVEDFIREKVLPNYGNTHTTISQTAMQTTSFRDEARDVIRKAVGATNHDEVIFCGSGATAAVHKLLHHCIGKGSRSSRKFIVFLGPYEHHSNILPWREAADKVIQVPLTISGTVDLNFLEAKLEVESEEQKKWRRKKKLIIGCFSAGSNVTGALTDDVAVTALLHRFGALAFWDYAAAAPHVQINMNPEGAYKDALFFSGHKFLGGSQTPGVLIVKKDVFCNPIPHGAGGGTVLFATRKRHKYLQDLHEREEGGTPDIVGSIRLGLIFRVRNLVGINLITEIEAKYCRRALDSWKAIPQIHILGSSKNPRLPIVSFVIEHLESGFFLHHNFVVALLNDLFGIQCRGGCMCAGPYAQNLLDINDKIVREYERALANAENEKKMKKEGEMLSMGNLLKPGFVRISFSYHSTPEEVDFVIEAVKLIAREGWKLLPLYYITPGTATFTHAQRKVSRNPMSLIEFDSLLQNVRSSQVSTKYEQNEKGINYEAVLEDAHLTFREVSMKVPLLGHIVQDEYDEILNSPDLSLVKWFMTPLDSFILQLSNKSKSYIKSRRPFSPLKRFGSVENSSYCNDSIPGIIQKHWAPAKSNDYPEINYNPKKCFVKPC